MEEQIWTYLVIGFLCLIILIQWYTNKWAIDEKDWLKKKCISLFPSGQQIQAAARLDDEYRNRRK